MQPSAAKQGNMQAAKQRNPLTVRKLGGGGGKPALPLAVRLAGAAPLLGCPAGCGPAAFDRAACGLLVAFDTGLL